MDNIGDNPSRQWPREGVTRVPYWVYQDAGIYQREQELIFAGPTWNYVGLEVEIPRPGDFRRSYVGEKPVVVARGEDGRIRVFHNRCAHRGVQFCRPNFGAASEFICPYHQWTYDLSGNLTAVPFRRGVKGKGGMPEEFKLADHGLRTLNVAGRHGVIFASQHAAPPAFEDYLGPSMLSYFDRVFDGRDLRVLGYSRQRIKANWKLMVENIRDTYHATLLHVFLVTFGLFRADNVSQVKMDAIGMHSAQISSRSDKAGEGTSEMRNFRSDFRLRDPRLLEPVREYPGVATVVMQTLWPNLIIQQQSNTLATRQVVPRGPLAFDLIWTFFGYAGDSPAMTQRRLRQANLMGPAGLVSIDDGEAVRFTQEGVLQDSDDASILLLGGHGTGDEDHMVTDASARAFYQYYRQVMDL